MDTQYFLSKLQVVRKRPSRIVDYLREPRSIVVGGPFVNQLGLQVFRTCKDRIAWHARPDYLSEDIRTYHDVMDRDGILVIPDFLPTRDFEQLYAEYKQSRVNPPANGYKEIVFGDNFLADELLVTDRPAQYPAFIRMLRDNILLQKIASAVSRRAMTYDPHLSIFHVHKPNPQAPHTDLDYNQFLHSDRHYPFIKCFFYLEDVNEDNAPYTYARGSHRITPARLRYEYAYSLRYARIRKGSYRRSFEQLAADMQLRELAEALMREQALRPEPICGKANTMVISNNQGFHARGPMHSIRPRVTVNIDFKYLESHAQWMYPVLKHLYRLGASESTGLQIEGEGPFLESTPYDGYAGTMPAKLS